MYQKTFMSLSSIIGTNNQLRVSADKVSDYLNYLKQYFHYKEAHLYQKFRKELIFEENKLKVERFIKIYVDKKI